MDERIQSLIDKILAGSATGPEKNEVTEWYESNNEIQQVWETDFPDEEKRIEKRMLLKLQNHMDATSSRARIFRPALLMRIAAVLLIVLMVPVYFYSRKSPAGAPAATGLISAPLKFSGNKFLVLRDSSTVILRPGSRLRYTFNGKTREISLSGEAYFDVRHLAAQPFVIHSGNVTVTVLGTAFNISAYPGKKVTVVVKRGKVSVADSHDGLLAVLTPDRQLIYSPETHTASEQQAAAAKAVAWVGSDVQFSGVPFKELAEQLSRRYGVTINFEDGALEKYAISGRFSGTEPLDVLLTALCGTSSSSYKMTGNTITIFKN